MTKRRFLTLAEAAERLGTDVRTVRRLIRENKLRAADVSAFEMSSGLVIHPDEIDAFAKRNKVPKRGGA